MFFVYIVQVHPCMWIVHLIDFALERKRPEENFASWHFNVETRFTPSSLEVMTLQPVNVLFCKKMCSFDNSSLTSCFTNYQFHFVIAQLKCGFNHIKCNDKITLIPDQSGNLPWRKAALQRQAILLPKTLFTHESALCFRNTPGEEWTSQMWSVPAVLSCFSSFCSQLFFFYSFVLELGSNPLKSAGIEANAFSDLKRVSYIRIADTEITEIPKGKALNFISTISLA